MYCMYKIFVAGLVFTFKCFNVEHLLLNWFLQSNVLHDCRTLVARLVSTIQCINVENLLLDVSIDNSQFVHG